VRPAQPPVAAEVADEALQALDAIEPRFFEHGLCRRSRAACSASPRCCLTSRSYGWRSSLASPCRETSPISLRVSSPSPPEAQRGDDWSVFLRRLWRRVPRHTPVRRHARSIRRHLTARRLDTELRHLWTCLFGRCCRHDFVPRCLATATLKAQPRDARPAQARPPAVPSRAAERKARSG
jgi:hypothetical protein